MMPPLLAALSPDQGRVAALIPTPSSSSIRVQILHGQTATLQSTLLHRRDETTTTPEQQQQRRPQKIFFVNNHLVAAFLSDLIVVWDLNRGVVASTIQPNQKRRHGGDKGDATSQRFVDAVPCGGKLYVLVWSSETTKAQIHCFKAETGKVEQKIKAGSKGGPVLALAVAGSTVVVRHQDSLRMLNVQDGHKISKYTSLKATTAATNLYDEDSNSQQVLAVAGDLVATIDGGEALLVNCTTGKRVGAVPCDAATDDLELCLATQKSKQDGDSSSSLLLLRVGSKVYTVSTEDGSSETTTTSLQCRIAPAPSVGQRILFVHSHSVQALLQKANEFQMAVATFSTSSDNADTDDVTLDWTTSTPAASKEAIAAAAKRKKDAVAVLGPAQVGGPARGIADGPVPKKPRSEQSKAQDDDDDDVEMKDAEASDVEEENDEITGDEDDEGPSIADRLRKLQEAFDAEDDETEEGGKAGGSNTDFQPKKATTESLTQLLEQALQSSDDAMLELALNVRDPRILQETCQKLSDEHLPTLLNALTSRLASKPTRANQLCPWISVLLQTGRIRSIAHLQPLRNLLEERVEVFPALLKLEGRLGMMTNL